MKLILLIPITLTVAASVGSNRKLRSKYIIYEENLLNFIDYEEKIQMFEILESGNEVIVEDHKSPNNAYLLFTRSNPYVGQVLVMGNSSTVTHSNFNRNAVTVFLVHGWNGHGGNSMNLLLTEALLVDGDVNVIAVDWRDIANKNYITAKAGVPVVGEALGLFIDWLVTLQTSYDQIHLVGFSLGAHVVGNAGRKTGSLVKRITALDPGGPLWQNDKNRLMPTDARYVEVIHTNTALYGFEGPCGHADFYPNGGYRMPGCILNYCSHRRSYEYMAKTLKSNELLASECVTLQDAFDDTCAGTRYPMGTNDLTKNRSGIFRVNTNEKTVIEIYY